MLYNNAYETYIKTYPSDHGLVSVVIISFSILLALDSGCKEE